jgi:hypothetical protein
MAKIKFGMMMTDARGKLGGQVFSKNRSCAYVRTKVTPVNPQTSFQSSVRALFGSISQQWSGLSQATRDAWDGAVNDWQTTNIFGDLVNPTGKALFQRLNNQAQVVGLAAVTTPPAKLVMPDDIVTAASFDVTIPEIDLTGVNAEATTRVALYATAPLSQGTKFVKNRLRLIYAAAGNAFSGSATGDAYIAKFGIPLAGANVYVGVKYVLANGQASPLQIVKAEVVD